MSRVKKLTVPSGNSSVTYDIAVDYSNVDNPPSIPEDLEDLTDWASTSDATVSSVTYHTYWKIAPTSTNDVYGWAFHPTNGLLYYIRSNKGALSATAYSANTNTKVRLYKDETGTYPIIGSRTAASSVTSGSTEVYGEISGTKAITMTPSTGTITATTFSGKATSAGNSDTVNNLTVETAVPLGAKFTDTTYESKTAVSEGTDVSLVTTGEKYTWNTKINYYCTCDTAAATAAKTTSTIPGFVLATGTIVQVKFTNSNTVANPTLNVSGSGAKSIKRYGTTAPSTSADRSWIAGSVQTLVYDGTYWMLCNWLNTTYTLPTIVSGTFGTANNKRTVTLSYQSSRTKCIIWIYSPLYSGGPGSIFAPVMTQISGLSNQMTAVADTDIGYIGGGQYTGKVHYTVSTGGVITLNVERWASIGYTGPHYTALYIN